MRFENYNPIVIFLYFIIVLLITMFTINPILLLISLIGGVLFFIANEGIIAFLKDLTFYIPLFILIAITNPLFSHNGATPLFFMNGNAITYEAIVYGIFIAVMIVSVMYWCKCFSRIFTTDKILYLVGRISPRLSIVISMAVRFIPLVKLQSKKVSNAQKAMGLYTSDSYVDKIKSALRVFSSVLTWGLENGIEVSDSMQSRGYGLKGRTSWSPFRFTIFDSIFIIISIILGGITFYCLYNKSLEFNFYPHISQVPKSSATLFSYCIFSVLCLIPFIMEVKEVIKWKYFLSKI